MFIFHHQVGVYIVERDVSAFLSEIHESLEAIVFAAGNSGSSVSFPATVNGVIAVGAVDKNGALCSYSARGSEINLVAPSGALDYTGDIRTLDLMGSAGLYPGNYLSTFGGTSASCPQVSGVAALLLSINPKLTEAEVRNILGHSARKIGSYSYSTVSEQIGRAQV